jgi:hypothetical protein
MGQCFCVGREAATVRIVSSWKKAHVDKWTKARGHRLARTLANSLKYS